MGRLSAAELQIIRSMLVKHYGLGSPFLDQLTAARVERRRMTGAGIFVHLLIDDAKCVNDINSEITEGYPTSLDPPRDVVGFTLFIRKGCLSFLEGYTFGDVKWPDDLIEKWLLLDAA
jgi:hypothetical protein